MITPAHFIDALEKVKAEGRWSMGLIIGDWHDIDFGERSVSFLPLTERVTEQDVLIGLKRAFTFNQWLTIALQVVPSANMMNRLRLLSAQNRIEDGDESIKQPDQTRIIVAVNGDVLLACEKAHPDFRQMFGPIITI